MSTILTIVANPEKLQEQFKRFCSNVMRRFAINVTHIWILMGSHSLRNTHSTPSMRVQG